MYCYFSLDHMCVMNWTFFVLQNFLQKFAITETANLTKILTNPTLKILLIEVVVGILIAIGNLIYKKALCPRKNETGSKNGNSSLTTSNNSI